MNIIRTTTYFAAIMLTLFLIPASAQHLPESRPVNLDLTAAQWRADLEHFAREVPRLHKNAFHTMSRQQFDAAVKRLGERIPDLKSEEIVVELMKIIAMIGDGHTSIEEQAHFNFGIYPVRYHIYPDGLYIQSAPSEYSGIVGGKVIAFGDAPVEKAISLIDELSWGDNFNDQSKKVEIVFLLTNPLVLKGLKIARTSESVPVTVEVGGVRKTVEIKAVKNIRAFMQTASFVSANAEARNPLPLYLKKPGNPYWFEYDSQRQFVYVQVNAVTNKPDESLAAFFTRVFDFVERNPVEKFVLDIRANTGGNNQLNTPVVIGLIRSKLNVRGKMFVITGRRTFSAAQNLLNEIEKYTNAILVGEPSGSSPNLFGDPVILTLPNTKLPVKLSSKWHQIDPSDRRKYTTPEVYAEMNPEDFRNNIDPPMDAIINYVPGSTFKDLASAAMTGEITDFIRRYKAFKAVAANKFVNTEAGMNALGYRLIQAKRVADAIEIFKLNVEAYPESANVFDSLGEAYALLGNKAEAIKSYEMALKIDPQFSSSLEALRKLKGS